MLRSVIALLISVLVSSVVCAAERTALVIGNQAYNDKIGPLNNPRNDVAVVGKALSEVGFELLPPRLDAKRSEILYGVYSLASQARSAGKGAITFLYYAGHGIAVGGENVLIPADADDTSDATLGVLGVRVSEILDILKREAPDAVHFLVLDACRTIRGRRGDRGFAPVNDRRTGVVIAFSTAPGEAATDEGATSAPYAAALADEIVKPGQNDQAMFNAVRIRVVNSANGQTPWTHDGLIGERVVFKAANKTLPTVTAAPSQPRLSEAAEAWSATKDTQNIAALETFVRRFGDTFFGDLAKARIADLNRLAPMLPLSPKTFDGTWSFTAQSGPGCVTPAWNSSIFIHGSQITTSAKQPGKLSLDGSFLFYYPASFNRDYLGTFVGKLAGQSGKGTFKYGNRCSGTISLKQL